MKKTLPINTIIQGDCLEVLKTFEDNSVDSCVSDPPAAIGFMGKEWDSDKGGRDNWIKWLSEIMIEVKRVLKPGGHCLIWALPRTSHWTSFALENAGFEIRDVVSHIFAQGFPKSLDIGKKIGKEAEKNWEGWGTSLKPAVEFWILCRKPISEKTIAENVLKWGVGGINIDECRIPYTPENPPIPQLAQGKLEIKTENGMYGGNSYNESKTKSIIGGNLKGRFPSNLILDEKSAKMLDEQTGILKSGKMSSKHTRHTDGSKNGIYGKFDINHPLGETYGDSGGASRFFYCAKSSKSERNLGFEGGTGSNTYNKKCLICGKWERKQSFSDNYTCHCENPNWETSSGNNHPTVKPIALMRYLCKLVTPKNGIILDPFLGSGSTILAAKIEGFNWIGIEKEFQYIEIAKKRIDGLEQQLKQ